VSWLAIGVLAAGTYAAYLVVDGVVTPTAQNWSFTPPSTLTVSAASPVMPTTTKAR